MKRAKGPIDHKYHRKDFAVMKFPRSSIKKVINLLKQHDINLVINCLEILIYNRDLELRRFAFIELGKHGNMKHRNLMFKLLTVNRDNRVRTKSKNSN